MRFYSILYNRGVYPEESFARTKKYGLPLLLTQDEGVKSFLSNLTSQLSGKLISSHTNIESERERERMELMRLLIRLCVYSFLKSGWKLGSYRG